MHSLLHTLRSLGPAKLTATLAIAAGLLGVLIWTAYRADAPQALALPYLESPADAGLGPVEAGKAGRLQALEDDLARSIAGIAGIERAEVHLVLPETAADGATVIAPSAAVAIATPGPLPLTPAQVGAVRQLVATSVPGLRPQAVSVVDDKGNLLARGDGAEDATAAADRSEELRIAYEQRLARSIEDLLAPSLGAGNVRAQVSATIDFDRLTETTETFDPEGQVLRSSQIVEDVENTPGAAADGAADAEPSAERNEEALDYAISRSTRTQVRQGGKLQRLSVAVVVNGSKVAGEDGTLQYKPRSSGDMAQIESLVRAAVGIDESRGDRLNVVNLPFTEAASLLSTAEAPGFAGFSLPELLRLTELLVLGAIAFAVIFFIVRPLIGRGQGGLPPDAQISAGGAVLDEMTPAARDGSLGFGGRLAQPGDQGRTAHRVGEIVRSHPEAAITVVRGWLQRET